MIEPLLLSLQVSGTALAVVLAPGILLGTWLARTRSRARLFVETLVMAPLVLPPVATGVALLYLFAYTPPLRGIPLTWPAAAGAAAVLSFPFLVQSVRTAVAGVDPELEAVARTLGARPSRVLRTVTLPLAWRGIVAGGLLAFCKSLGEFGATMVVAGNIPGRTRTLALAIFTASETGKESRAWELMGVSAVLAFVILILARRVERA